MSATKLKVVMVAVVVVCIKHRLAPEEHSLTSGVCHPPATPPARPPPFLPPLDDRGAVFSILHPSLLARCTYSVQKQ